MKKTSMIKEETQELMKDDVKLENLENGSKIPNEKKELALEDGMFCSCSFLYIVVHIKIKKLVNS